MAIYEYIVAFTAILLGLATAKILHALPYVFSKNQRDWTHSWKEHYFQIKFKFWLIQLLTSFAALSIQYFVLEVPPNFGLWVAFIQWWVHIAIGMFTKNERLLFYSALFFMSFTLIALSVIINEAGSLG